ncbi:histone H1-delta [Penaeus vannamei]|uniref:Histone 1o n=1 Tax=Penaeus vannamei TaxID=6689 RepID=A0A423SAF1_PENVA|nr:histone H1-delta-like [Penaeus vannamei]ROT61201.1 histone 1o [Penaeus vannamei]
MAERDVKRAGGSPAAAGRPKYSEMVAAAIGALKERSGSSRQAILKYILAFYGVGDEKRAGLHVKLALRKGVTSGSLVQLKGTGASGSFKLAKVEAAPKKPIANIARTKTAATKKPASEKSAAKKTTKQILAKKNSVKKATAKKDVKRKPTTKKESLKKATKEKVSANKSTNKKPTLKKNAIKQPTAKKIVKKSVSKKTEKKSTNKKVVKK